MSSLKEGLPEAVLDGLPGAFSCKWTSGRGAEWASLAGELDMAWTPGFERGLRSAEAHARLIVLDLRELSFIDGRGTRAILHSSQRLRQAGGRLIVVRGPRAVDMVFTVTECAKQIEILDLEPTEPVARVLLQTDAG